MGRIKLESPPSPSPAGRRRQRAFVSDETTTESDGFSEFLNDEAIWSEELQTFRKSPSPSPSSILEKKIDSEASDPHLHNIRQYVQDLQASGQEERLTSARVSTGEHESEMKTDQVGAYARETAERQAQDCADLKSLFPELTVYLGSLSTPLTPVDLAGNAKLDALAADCISNDSPSAEGKSKIAEQKFPAKFNANMTDSESGTAGENDVVVFSVVTGSSPLARLNEVLLSEGDTHPSTPLPTPEQDRVSGEYTQMESWFNESTLPQQSLWGMNVESPIPLSTPDFSFGFTSPMPSHVSSSPTVTTPTHNCQHANEISFAPVLGPQDFAPHSTKLSEEIQRCSQSQPESLPPSTPNFEPTPVRRTNSIPLTRLSQAVMEKLRKQIDKLSRKIPNARPSSRFLPSELFCQSFGIPREEISISHARKLLSQARMV